MDIQRGDIFTRDELSEYVGAGGDGCFLHSQIWLSQSPWTLR